MTNMEKKQSYAAELPLDALTEILLRLPAESLVRCKRVCKSWHRLIDSEQFVKWHLDRHSRSRPMILPRMDLGYFADPVTGKRPMILLPRISFFSFDFENPEPKAHCTELCLEDCLMDALPIHIWPNLYVIRSCDGLLLIRVHDWCRGASQHLLVCNPTTKSYTLLPPPSNCDLSKSRCTIVHDISVQRYKIIVTGPATITASPLAMIRCFVFELTRRGEGRGWKELRTCMPSNCSSCLMLPALSAGEKVHWLIKLIHMNQDMGNALLSLHLPTESLRITKILHGVPAPTRWGHSVVFSDRVICCPREEPSSRNLELWILEDFDNPVWRKHHVISNFPTGYNTWDGDWEGIYVEEAGKLILNFLGYGFVYDMSSRTWRKIKYYPQGTWYSLPAYSRHVSSLVRWG